MAFLCALLALTIPYPSSISDLRLAELVLGPRYQALYDPSTLGITSRIYVLSLPQRDDRRASMDYLRLALNLDWRYVRAFGEDDATVISIMRHLRDYRENLSSQTGSTELLKYNSGSIHDSGKDTEREGSQTSSASAQDLTTAPLPAYRFSWPDDLDALASSEAPLSRSGSDGWSTYPDTDSSHLRPAAPVSAFPQPWLACTTENLVIPENRTLADNLPPYLQLTPAKIACWHSHLEILRAVATSGRESGPALVMEDDVDIEWDIGKRLNEVWSALPDDWDIVFLGGTNSTLKAQKAY